MTALLVSIALLLLGPLLLWAARRQPILLAILDGFTLFAVGGLVCLDILPHALEQAGLWTVPLALAGLFVPTAFERLKSRGAARAHALALILGMIGVASHALMDGAAISGGREAPGLLLAVILHRLPVGLAVWWLVRPAYGRLAATAVLVGISAATLGGYYAGEAWITTLGSRGVGLFSALVAGSLLHVLVHVHGPVVNLYDRTGRFAGTLGAVLGVVVVLLSLGHGHPGPHAGHAHAHEGGGFFRVFGELALESAPALVLAYLAAGLVFAFLPAATVGWLGRGGGFSSAGRGVLFALPIPICSCGVLPIYKGLIDKGVPATAAVALLIAAPELGLDAVFLSVQLLDGPFALARVIAAAVLALAVGWWLGGLARRTASGAAEGSAPPRIEGPPLHRLREGLRSGFVELVDDTAPWIILGLAIAAIAWPILGGEWLEGLPPHLEVPIFALLGMPIYVCASGATPIAAVLVAQGISPGAALAFLLTGPATNVTTFGILSQLHGRRFALLFAVVMAIGAIGIGYTVDAAIGPVETHFDRHPIEGSHDDGHHEPHADHDHDHAHDHGAHDHGAHDHGAVGSGNSPASGGHDHGWLPGAALLLLSACFLASLLRQGPRGFIGQVIAPPEGDSHDHCGGCH
jgi:uncharacterized membrane protein YraQ (UPF0718 family)